MQYNIQYNRASPSIYGNLKLRCASQVFRQKCCKCICSEYFSFFRVHPLTELIVTDVVVVDVVVAAQKFGIAIFRNGISMRRRNKLSDQKTQGAHRYTFEIESVGLEMKWVGAWAVTVDAWWDHCELAWASSSIILNRIRNIIYLMEFCGAVNNAQYR